MKVPKHCPLKLTTWPDLPKFAQNCLSQISLSLSLSLQWMLRIASKWCGLAVLRYSARIFFVGCVGPLPVLLLDVLAALFSSCLSG